MAEPRTSPKLQALLRWKYIDEVNQRLDAGETPNSVHRYINKNGFKISRPLIYEYAEMRKKALIDGINVEHMVGSVATRPLVDRDDPSFKSQKTKLKSEIDALDKLIEKGYNSILDFADKPVSPSTMMAAIKLKYDLTDGNHGFLTNYGMEELRDIEQKKYELLMEHLVGYIPEDSRQQALDEMEAIEDGYYQTTPYYEEYLRAKGLSETDIARKLKEVSQHNDENNQES